ncbi:uncharacterized protein [Chelonus insularis]|uniref:uncharacterized protein n=1 Tax=Chelonus insularis TaxID=460826 RepID=UPI00158DE791|nr:uncharacterized protein LOC118066276 [Chelonus insularis]
MDCNFYSFFHILIICLISTCPMIDSRYTKHHAINLTELTNSDFKNFLNSFDIVITDIDGVIRQYKSEPIDVFIVLQKLKELGKRNILITSNSYFSSEDYSSFLIYFGYNATSDEIVVPSDALIWYLKRINFTDKAYVIGCDLFVQSLKKSGLNIVIGKSIEGNVYNTSHLFDIDKEVKIVIVDFDAHVNWLKLNMAGVYLKNDRVAFLAGASEMQLPALRDDRSMGSSYFLDILMRYSKRKPLLFGKPGKIFGDYILERFSVSDSSRVLFIGDSIDVDMKFADMYSFKKLLIGPGMYLSKSGKCMKDSLPIADYFIDDLNEMLGITLKMNFLNLGQFILPHESLLWYLKKFQMKGKAFVVGSDKFIQTLKDAGVDVVSAPKYANVHNNNHCNPMAIDRRVNTVIVDLDTTVNLGQIAQAGLYLKNENVQFLAGTAQKQIYVNKFHKVIGPGYFEDVLINYSGRIPLHYGKPGGLMRDYIMDRYPAIASNPSRVLFIGNSIDVDIKYAYMCGFQKLWLNPDANESTVSKLVNNCMTNPDYYLSDISKMRFIGCR